MGATQKPITQQQFLVTIKGIDSYWEKFSGIKDKAETTEYNDGLSNRKFQLVGPRKLDEIELEKAYDPVADAPIIRWWRNFCDGKTEAVTISIVSVTYCPNIEPFGPTKILYGCKPVSLEYAEVDKTSNDISKLKLTFIADDWEES